MSDSHDNLEAIRSAVQLFNKQNLDLVIHAGDLISPFTALEFQKLDPELLQYMETMMEREKGLKMPTKKFLL